MLKEELTILFTWVDSLSSESMYTPKFLTTAELVILSSPILMESSLTLSSCCQTPTMMNSVLFLFNLRKFKLIHALMSSKQFSKFLMLVS